jgi:hypothetical protein
MMRRTVRHWLGSWILHIESNLQRTWAKELPSLLMDTVIMLVGAEGAAQINARYGSDPVSLFHISDRFAPFHTKVINTMYTMRRTQNSGQTFAYHQPSSILIPADPFGIGYSR